ncbi:MAG: hypothetical protein ACLTK8_00580 [Paeniclostridium sp.]
MLDVAIKIQQSSQATPESSQTSEKNLTIEDVEGYGERKSDEEGILKLGWKMTDL